MRILNINVRLLLIISCCFLVVSALRAKKLYEFSKTWEKSFEVELGTTLDLNNKFGNIHITTWKQKEISIKVIITVDVVDQEKANQLLDRIQIMDEVTLEKVIVATKFDMEKGSKLNKKLQVDYVVKMPVSNNLKVVNKFGDLYISELDGRANLKVSYGNLKCDVLNNANNRIKLSYSNGKCSVGDFTSGSIEMKYSNLSVNKADKLNLDIKYSKFRIGSATTMDCKSQYDQVVIERVGDLELEGKFSGYDIGTVVRKLELDIRYSGCEVNRITSQASKISVENSYGSVDLCFEEGTGYHLEAEGQFGGIDYPKSLTTLTTNVNKSTSFYVLGVVGDENSPTAKVNIKTSYGSVELTYK